MKLMKLFFSLLFFVNTLQARPYVTAKLNGQLGNQLFQVATALALALDHDAEALFPEFTYRSDEGIPVNKDLIFFRVNMNALPIPIETVWIEPKHTFTAIQFTPNMQLEGYFQSYKYFDNYRDYLVKLFAPKEEFLDGLKQRFSKIANHPNTVAIHIRTYHKEDPKHSNFARCDRKYVKAAMEHFSKDSLFVIFSDNISWCRKKFSKLAKHIIFMEGNTHIEDFFLISLCKHQIISNSSFSWWAAYLNQNPDKKVIAPKRWFATRREYDNKEITPEDWIIIDNIKG